MIWLCCINAQMSLWLNLGFLVEEPIFVTSLTLQCFIKEGLYSVLRCTQHVPDGQDGLECVRVCVCEWIINN